MRPPGTTDSAGPGADGPQDARLEVYGDSAYGSGEARAAYRDAGHDTVIKPGPLRPAVPGGFTLDDFTIDEQAGHGHLPGRRHPADEQDPDGDLRRGLRRLPAAGSGAPPPKTAGP